jgi:putative FmdB family regulatory protein
VPLYEYQCAECGRFEIIQKFSDALLKQCPTCGKEVHKLLSAPAIQFKGTGWYITDYARKSSGGEGGGKDGSSKDGGSKEGSSSEGASKSKDGGSKDTGSADASGSSKSTTTKESSGSSSGSGSSKS